MDTGDSLVILLGTYTGVGHHLTRSCHSFLALIRNQMASGKATASHYPHGKDQLTFTSEDTCYIEQGCFLGLEPEN